MNSAPNPTDSSLLLWLVAAAVAILGAHVVQRWSLVARRKSPLWRQWPALLAGGAMAGSALVSTMLLGTSAQGLMFPIGYPPLWAAGLWAATMVACVPVVALFAATDRWWTVLPGALLLAVVALAQQAGWLMAAGFRPGIQWNLTLAAVAATVCVLGLAAAAWVSFTPIVVESPRRRLWLLGAAVLAGVALTAGQELLIAAAGLVYQVDSIYRARLPNSVLCLVAGVLVPLVLTLVAVDLSLRSPLRGDKGADGKKRRRRRRYRIRHL